MEYIDKMQKVEVNHRINLLVLFLLLAVASLTTKFRFIG